MGIKEAVQRIQEGREKIVARWRALSPKERREIAGFRIASAICLSSAFLLRSPEVATAGAVGGMIFLSANDLTKNR